MNIPCIIRRLDPEVPFPVYKTPGAVAFDLAVFEETDLTPGETKMLRTGLVICVPEGYAIILAGNKLIVYFEKSTDVEPL